MGEEENIDTLKTKFEAALLEKDATITLLNVRILNLEKVIENQSAILEKINANFTTLNSKVLGSGFADGEAKRKRPTGQGSNINTGPIDKFLSASAGQGSAEEVPMDDDSVQPNRAVSSGIDSNLNAGLHSNMQAHVSNSGASFAAVTAKNVARPMPLQLGVTDRTAINQIIELLNEFDKSDFDFVQLKGGSPPRIFPKNSNVKDNIIKLFQANGIEFNSYSEKGEKRQSYIVRGLNYGDDSSNITYIRRSIADVGIICAVDCSRFLTGHMKRSDDVNLAVLYRFTLDSNANESSLLQIKSINGFRVSIEKMRKSVVIQCHRCQRFQHTAKSCSFGFRCVQCVTKHGPGVCPRTLNKKLPLQCCNCVAAGLKNANHTANNLNACSFFKQKHSVLFDKFQKNVSSTAQHRNVNSNINHSGGGASTQSNQTSTDVFIGPTPANNPASSKKKKKKSKSVPVNQNSSGRTSASESIKSNTKSNFNSNQNPVNSGKSHSGSGHSSNGSSQRVEALIGAFSKLLREFCNAT